MVSICRNTTPGLTLMRIALVATLLAALFAALPVAAQWTDVGSTRAASEREALVRSDDAAELRIWLDKTSGLHLQFMLAPGLLAFAPGGCVTLQVDDYAIPDLSAPEYECSSDGASIQLLLTQVKNRQINSPILLDLMNGKRVELRYRLAHAGYGSAQFSLKGSKQALTDTLGGDITIIGD